MPKLYTFFEDNAGGFSMMRLSLGVWLMVLSFIFVAGSIKNGWKPVDIPDSAVTILGALALSKGIQRYGENGTVTPTSPPPV